ncbi:magnesium chelatase [Halobacteriales archaeon QS_4_70_19]|nr:MAG: magnesium chelatase [Halobacteriales archaeon QS_4_70_19]
MVDFARIKSLSGSDPPGRQEGPSFADIVGQEELKRALLAVGASDALSGLLVRGEKGTAKSTAVRALAALLPEQQVVADCPFGCHPDPDAPDARAAPPQCPDCRERSDPPTATRRTPLVTLPLGATRDRLVGTLSVADALDGEATFDPGLLARANRGVLYVDEVNLLGDHLVDVLLDAAAGSVNRVERDGVSVQHPAAFTLVGTMNPEEGDLRPQFRDRFDLRATVAGLDDTGDRVRVLRGALARDQGEEPPREDTTTEWADRATDLRRARERLADGTVRLPDEFAAEIAELCRDAGVDGHRADIATARAALAFAALDDRPRVLEPDVRRAAELALPHRLQSRPFEDAPDPDDLLDERFDGDAEADEGENEGEAGDPGADESEPGEPDATEPDGEGTDDPAGDDGIDDRGPEPGPGDGSDGEADGPGPAPDDADGAKDDATADDDTTAESSPAPTGGERTVDGGEPDDVDASEDADEAAPGTPLLPGQARVEAGEARAPDLPAPEAPEVSEAGGGGSAAASRGGDSGPRVRTRRAEADDRVDAAASVRAAAANGRDSLESRDLRASVRAGDATTLVLFVVDASASMRPAMRAAKGTLLELLRESYAARDEVGLVAFAGDDADVVLPPTDSVSRAARHLKELPTADRTPLPAGLRTASEVLERAAPDAGVVVLVTDGRANVAGEEDGPGPTAATRSAARALADATDRTLVVDAGEGRGLVDVVAGATGAAVVGLEALSADRVAAAARGAGTTRE